MYPGWWTVFGGGLLSLWGFGYNAYGISVLFKPISQELNFNRATTSVASSIGRFEGGIEAPLTGWITDRWGARWVVVLGVFLMSIALILMRYISTQWGYYLIWGLMLGTGTNVALSLPLDTSISNWFVKKRGLATSIKWVFSGLSGVLVMPFIAWMVNTYDWRTACTVGGIVMAAGGLPIAFLLIKPRRPEYYGLLPDGAKIAGEVQASQEKMLERGAQYATEVKEVEFTVRQALKTRIFWVLFLSQSIPGLVAPVMSIHCIPFLTDPRPSGMGMELIKASSVMAMMLFFSLPTRFIGGWVADRISITHTRFIMTISLFLQGFGVLLFLLHPTLFMVYVWFIIFGLGQGLGFSIGPFMRARFFGRKAFGSIQGITSLIMTPIGVLAPVYAGWIYDTSGSYLFAFQLLAALTGVSVVLSLFLLPPTPPESITSVSSIV